MARTCPVGTACCHPTPRARPRKRDEQHPRTAADRPALSDDAASTTASRATNRPPRAACQGHGFSPPSFRARRLDRPSNELTVWPRPHHTERLKMGNADQSDDGATWLSTKKRPPAAPPKGRTTKGLLRPRSAVAHPSHAAVRPGRQNRLAIARMRNPDPERDDGRKEPVAEPLAECSPLIRDCRGHARRRLANAPPPGAARCATEWAAAGSRGPRAAWTSVLR